jgi:NAD+ synthase (glutamine-hydrolysing)
MEQIQSELDTELKSIRTKRAFEPEQFVNSRTNEFLRYLEKFNIQTVILSVSGGVDSACVLGLLKKAQEKANTIPSHPFNISNGGRIIALAQPIYSTPAIQSRAYELCEAFDIELKTFCQDEIHSKIFEREFGEPMREFSSSMLKSYLRTPVAYSVVSNYSGVVIGTGNLDEDEDGYLYYYCKFGDGAVDIGLIWDLHKSEVFTVSEYLGVPKSILEAKPSADLYPNQTDEDEIGVSYDMIELIYNYLTKFNNQEQEEFMQRISPEAWEFFKKQMLIVETIHKKGLHKSDLNPKNMGSYIFKKKLKFFIL